MKCNKCHQEVLNCDGCSKRLFLKFLCVNSGDEHYHHFDCWGEDYVCWAELVAEVKK